MDRTAYLWTGKNCKQENMDVVKSHTDDIKQFGEGTEATLLGEMNGHIEVLDEYAHFNGKVMQELCEQHNLVMVKREPKFGGQITWDCRNRETTIAYGLMSQGIYSKLAKMAVDEEGMQSLGSDHKRISLHIGHLVKGEMQGTQKVV